MRRIRRSIAYVLLAACIPPLWLASKLWDGAEFSLGHSPYDE